MSMSIARPSAALLAVLLLAAAAGPVAAPAPVARLRYRAVRDSSFSLPDSVRALLSRVTSLAVDPDSGVYVADPSLGAVLRLSPSGAFRALLGRRGAGPGEFRTALLVGLHQDSLWVIDPGLVRLTLLPRSGSTPLTVPLAGSAATLRSGRPQARLGMPSSLLADGSFLVEQSLREETDEGGTRWSERFLFHTDRALQILDTIARHTLDHTTIVFMHRDGELHMPQPFNDDPLYGVQPDGSTVAVVERAVPAKGLEGQITLRIWRGSGEPVITRRIPYVGRRLAQAAVDSAIGQYFTREEGQRIPGTPVTPDSVRNRLYRPAIFPPVEDVRVATDGAIWLKVRLEDSPAGVGDWVVLSRRGFPMYRVSLPAGFRVLQAGRRTLWGVENDELDVPLVVRYTVPERPT